MRAQLLIISTVLAFAIGCMLGAYVKEQRLTRPYRARFAHLSDMELIAEFEHQYDRLMRWIDQGGEGWPRFQEFLLVRILPPLEELKHRAVGDIQTLTMEQSYRARQYVEAHADSGYGR